MTVISGIQTAIKIAPIVYRAGKIIYHGIKRTKAGGQWLSRHPNVVKAGTVTAGAGGLILDLTNIDYSSLVPQQKPGKNGQTRKYVYGAKSGRFYNKKRKNLYCRPNVRKRQYSRSFYR